MTTLAKISERLALQNCLKWAVEHGQQATLEIEDMPDGRVKVRLEVNGTKVVDANTED